MIHFKQLWSAIEWGLLYGFITWILGTGISNRIPGWGVWLIIFDRVFMAIVLYYCLGLIFPKWLKGIIAGLIFSVPLGLVASQWPFFTPAIAHCGALGTGLIAGVLMAYFIRLHEPEEADSDNSNMAKT
ncbi:hypothetical protein JW835_07760 [bacterium]|nr:hypothetical protein [bacterium]